MNLRISRWLCCFACDNDAKYIRRKGAGSQLNFLTGPNRPVFRRGTVPFEFSVSPTNIPCRHLSPIFSIEVSSFPSLEFLRTASSLALPFIARQSKRADVRVHLRTNSFLSAFDVFQQRSVFPARQHAATSVPCLVSLWPRGPKSLRRSWSASLSLINAACPLMKSLSLFRMKQKRSRLQKLLSLHSGQNLRNIRHQQSVRIPSQSLCRVQIQGNSLLKTACSMVNHLAHQIVRRFPCPCRAQLFNDIMLSLYMQFETALFPGEA